MKKVLSLVIAVVMVASLAATAFATASPSLSPSLSPNLSPSASSELLFADIVGVVLRDADGNVVETTDDDYLIIIPYEEKDEAEAEAEVRAALEEAYASMKAAGSVGAVVASRADMVVCDIFDVLASEHIASVLENGGTVTATLDMQMEPGTEMDAIAYHEGKWAVEDESWVTAVTVEDNGDVNVTFNQLGVFALLSK